MTPNVNCRKREIFVDISVTLRMEKFGVRRNVDKMYQ